MNLSKIKNVPLRFELGELYLFSIHLKLNVYNHHFINETKDLWEIIESNLENETEKSSKGYLFLSFPSDDFTKPAIHFRNNHIVYVWRSYRRYFLPINGTFESYLGKFKSKTRSNLRKKIKKFEEESNGSLIFKEYISDKELEVFFPIARSISEKTYQEQLLNIGLPNDNKFYNSMLEAAKNGHVRAYILFLNNNPVAYLYLPIVNENIILYSYAGYDLEYSKLSPGTVLQYLAIQRLYENSQGMIFDFTEGESTHKELFSSEHIRCSDIFVLKLGIKNLLVATLHYSSILLNSWSRKILEFLGIKKLMKSFIRSFFMKQAQKS